MQNNGSVMNGLHKISGKIAEAARTQVSPAESSSSDSPVAPPSVESKKEDPRSTNAVTPPQTGFPKPQQQGKNGSGSILGDALLRRYEDFLKTRRDLAARIVRETESLRLRQDEVQQEAEKIRQYLTQLDNLAVDVNATDEAVDPGNQAVFAAECRKIEHLRLELFRIAEQTKILAEKKKSDGTDSNALSFLPLLDSLSFGQFAKAGFAFFFPLLAALIFSAFLIAAALILSFNGTFAW